VKKIFRSKWFKIPFYTFTYGFALIGAFLTLAYMAIKFQWTNEEGSVDSNNRYFQEMADKYNQEFALDSATLVQQQYEAYERLLLLNEYYPKNAQQIVSAMKNEVPEIEVLRMLDAVDLQLRKDPKYTAAVAALKKKKRRKTDNALSAYDWMNIVEWQDFKLAVAKDKKVIDSVARQTGVEARLIVACLVGEQIRLFNSDREAFKAWVSPLKVLYVESQFSFGITGIKEHTAKRIENNIKTPGSEFYLGQEYEHLLDFSSEDTAVINDERISRLTNFHNHYYSYLYAALFLKQVKSQWEKAGYPIDHRPEILVTLFNLGFPQSKPKSNPKVGGSHIQIKDKSYTFGAIGYQFYYSGELFELFPIGKKKFDWNKQG
jgi:hypothetical protein